MSYTTLNEKDFKLFSFLEAHIYLTIEQIRTAIYLNDDGSMKSEKSVWNRLTKLEEDKIELVRKLYKIDEHYDIDELQTLQRTLTIEKDTLEKGLILSKNK